MVSTKTTHSFVDCTEYSWNKDLSRDESTPRPKVQEPRDEKVSSCICFTCWRACL